MSEPFALVIGALLLHLSGLLFLRILLFVGECRGVDSFLSLGLLFLEFGLEGKKSTCQALDVWSS